MTASVPEHLSGLAGRSSSKPGPAGGAKDSGSRSVDQVQLLASKASVGVWSWDLQTGVMTWSEPFWRQLDIDHHDSELSFREFCLKVHPDDRPAVGEIEDLVAKGVPFERTVRLVRADGRLRFIELKGEPLFEAGRASASVLGVAVDVTARQEALQSLKNSVSKLGAFRAAVADSVLFVRPDGSLLEAPAAGSYVAELGFARCKRGWLDIAHPDDRLQAEAQWQRAAAQGARFSAKFRVQPGGRARLIGVHGVPVPGSDDRPTEWVLVVGDVDETPAHGAEPQLTGAQVRAARGILRWSVRDLAEKSNTSIATIRRIEDTDGVSWRGHSECEALRTVLEQAGVEFLFPQNGKPGARPA